MEQINCLLDEMMYGDDPGMLYWTMYYEGMTYSNAREYIKRGDLNTVIEHDFDVRYDDDALLIVAVLNEHVEVVEELVRMGCDINAQDGRVLVEACKYCEAEDLKMLLKLGAKPTKECYNIVSKRGDGRLIEILHDNIKPDQEV
jgi:hypothetical protein